MQKYFSFTLGVIFISANTFLQAQGLVKKESAPIPAQKGVTLQIPEHLRKKGGKLRIKNKETGKEAILDISDEEFINSEAVQSLLTEDKKTLVPEFSILESVKTVRARLPAPTDPTMGGFRISKSLIFDQPTWKVMGYRAQRLKSGIIKIEIDPKVQNVVISVDEAARRRSLKEARALRSIFDAGFIALKNRQYAVSLEAFERILQKQELLSAPQRIQAHYGRGVSNFHQKGCADTVNDFKVADQDPQYFEDISYYRALCFVEAQKFDDAQTLFQELVRRQSPLYAENSRFYLGIVAEKKESFDEAEMAYMDTIDFAQDAQLVNLAKDRLEQVKRLRAELGFQRRFVNFAASFGTGYDTNVVALPAGLAPADYGISSKSSLNLMGLALMEIKVPFWGKNIDHRIRGNALVLSNLNSELSGAFDIQAYDTSMSLGFMTGERTNWVLGGGYSLIYSGRVGASTKLMATPSGEIKMNRVVGDLENPTADWDASFKYSQIQAATSTGDVTDANMQSFLLAYRYNIKTASPHIYGPGLDFEFRPATNGGTDNSYWSTTLVGKWDRPLGPESWALILSQEGAFQYTDYYQNSSTRKDFIARYTVGVARGLWEILEAKLALTTAYNYSNVTTYKYGKGQINFTLSGVF